MKKGIESVSPYNLGWLEYKLTDKEMDYVWRCIENKKGDYRSQLAGHLSGSYSLMDRGDWFYSNVLKPLVLAYGEKFESLGSHYSTSTDWRPFYLKEWWVNYQRQGEFNPLHLHGGIYSFVIWMKIPYDWKKQNKINHGRSKRISSFEIVYSTTLGAQEIYNYHLSQEDSGKMIFFPAKLRHCVYPFYNCDEDRISVSGNITLK